MEATLIAISALITALTGLIWKFIDHSRNRNKDHFAYTHKGVELIHEQRSLEIEQIRELHTVYESLVNELRSEVGRLSSQVSRMERENKKLTRENNKLRKEIAELRSELKQMREDSHPA